MILSKKNNICIIYIVCTVICEGGVSDFAGNTFSVIEMLRHKFRPGSLFWGASRHYHIILGDVRRKYMRLLKIHSGSHYCAYTLLGYIPGTPG